MHLEIAEIEDGDKTPRRLTLTVPTACVVSGLGPTTIWALIKQGRLQAIRINRRTLVTWESLQKLLTP